MERQSTWDLLTPTQQATMRDAGRTPLDGGRVLTFDRAVDINSKEFLESDIAKKNEASWPTLEKPAEPHPDHDPLATPAEDEDDEDLEDFEDDEDEDEDEDEDDDA